MSDAPTTHRNLEAEAALDDTLARTRALPLTQRDSIPRLPAGYQPTEPEVRNKRLRKMPRQLTAEAHAALRALARRGEHMRGDLGEFAPDARLAQQLARDIEEAAATKSLVMAQLAYLEEKEDLLLSDGMVLLEHAHKDYEYRVQRVPQIAEHYRELAEFIAARNKAISEGIARAKKDGKPGE